MPLQNMVAIQTVTVGSGGASSISFTSIPQTYTDLYILYSLRTANSGVYADVEISLNNATNAGGRLLYALNGSVNGATQGAFTFANGNSTTASTFGNGSAYISNYTSTSNKSISVDFVGENNSTNVLMGLTSGFYTTSTAVSSVTLTPGGTTFLQYSTATLYGVTSTIAGGAKAYGGTVTEDANYFYHTFLASGTFTPTQSITADCLVVAGGGGGGLDNGGGGGAGGLLAYTSQSLTATGYTITVGGGGASPSTGGQGANGSNSQFGSLTAPTGGGGGGGQSAGGANGRNGGSGGGTGNGTSTTAGTGTSGQGNNGGVGNSTAGSFPGGGGGGAGAAGGNAASATAGAGGAGSSSYSAWGLATGTGELVSGTYYYAGGGGAAGSPRGLGGAGGGGSGGVFSGTPLLGTSGLANTGGGGGGSAGLGSAASVSGGSGIVIVRYAK